MRPGFASSEAALHDVFINYMRYTTHLDSTCAWKKTDIMHDALASCSSTNYTFCNLIIAWRMAVPL